MNFQPTIVRSKVIRFLVPVALMILVLLLVSSCDQHESTDTVLYTHDAENTLNSMMPQTPVQSASAKPTSVPTPTISVMPSPLVLSPVEYRPAGERYREPIAPDSELGIITFQGENALFPAVYAPYCRRISISRDQIDKIARNTADRLWGSAHFINGVYEGPAKNTEYGNLIQRVGFSLDTVMYYAVWEDWEQEPYFFGDQVHLNETEAEKLADDFLTALGWKPYVSGEPKITVNYLVKNDSSQNSTQTVFVYWPESLPDHEMKASSVRVEILNGQISHATLDFSQYKAVEKASPDFLLSSEEALYCLNYARSMIHDKDNPLMQYPYLHSFGPAYRYDFSRECGEYIPTWVFYMSADKDNTGGMLTEIYVAADSGIVETGTNAGNMPSPYQ